MERDSMTCQEAGRRGGHKVAARYGREFYREIGKKGGRRTAASHGPEFYQAIGKKGGTKGGARVRDLIARAKALEAGED